MFKQLLSAILILSTSALFAQSMLRTSDLPFQQVPMPYMDKYLTGSEPMVGQHVNNPNLPWLGRTEIELTVGNTIYDLQSNSSTPRRLASHTDGTRYATWTLGTQNPIAFPDRGTGLNIYNPVAGSWGAIPTARIEDTRTGWPNVDVLADGTPIIISHRAGPERLYVSRWVNNTWAFSTIPTAAPSGVIWPRMAVGGPDGNSVHVIGLTYPTANGGAPYDGVDGHILYYRSLNGGVTWDKQDIILPEIDKDFYKRMRADAYAIDASGSTIVVAHFPDLGDVKVSKSTDNGETWTTWTVKDFPIDQYEIDQGYTVDDIPFDPNAPTPLAIQSSDNSGAVLIDKNGMVHAWYGEMYYADTDLSDNNFSYYPAWMGLRYWNETFGEDSTQLIITGIIDANGNGTADIASIDVIARYFSSLTSHPSAGIDDEGNIYLAYSGLTEDFIHPDSKPTPGQHCRHIYLIYSDDNGATWSEPIDVIRDDLVIEPGLLFAYETMFPAMDRHVDTQVHLIYQADFEPGLAVRGDMDPASDNAINYLAVDLEEFGIVGTRVVAPSTFSFEVSPNPASSFVKIAYHLPQAATTSIFVYDMLGRQVKTFAAGTQAAGQHSALFSVNDLAKGNYLVRLQSGDMVAVQMMMVK